MDKRFLPVKFLVYYSPLYPLWVKMAIYFSPFPFYCGDIAPPRGIVETFCQDIFYIVYHNYVQYTVQNDKTSLCQLTYNCATQYGFFSDPKHVNVDPYD